jgi:uncharacterized protein (DUF2236 family)
MRVLAGSPYTPDELDQLYGEFRAVCAECGLPDHVWPATAADVTAYIDSTIGNTLEYSQAVHHLLFEMLHQAPAPVGCGTWGLPDRCCAPSSPTP